jgi:hypothetical protein
VPADNFSVRWNGIIGFGNGGTFTFVATTNDGMRVWIDDELVFDKWFDQNTTEYRFNKTLSGGLHNVKIEFYAGTGDAVAYFYWQVAQ